jgi:anhydro-N-acetylmuramic acid kinase
MSKILTAMGMMSGTSLDGVDVAIIKTDGKQIKDFGPNITYPYSLEFKAKLQDCINHKKNILEVEKELTMLHYEAAKRLLDANEMGFPDIDIIGFHGQTIEHRPEQGLTWQIGNASLLAYLSRVNVVSDFRRKVVAAGGQGAPLVPIFHHAITRRIKKPIAIVNIGGVANVTWIGKSEENLVAFDTGPGNALIDDWVKQRLGQTFDKDGSVASEGKPCLGIVGNYLKDEFFLMEPPKSLDRNYFALDKVRGLSTEDGAATLSYFTAKTIAMAKEHFPEDPKRWFIAGGGRLNKYIVKQLKSLIGPNVFPIETLGFNGDALEAQAFAYLAVRSAKGYHIAYTNTCGVKSRPHSGGVFCPA